jgi:hypothetical protein
VLEQFSPRIWSLTATREHPTTFNTIAQILFTVMRGLLDASLFLGLASAADVSLLLFRDAQCTGDIISNVHSNPANEHAGSGCIATSTFQSAGLASVDSGFKCNVYADTACQNFLASVESISQCETLIGRGAICFSQESFENPLANIKAQVSIGSSIVHFNEVKSFEITDGALKGACGGTGCDPNAPFKRTLKNFPGSSKCTVTGTARGNYDNTNERDYMAQLISTSALTAGSVDHASVDGFGNPDLAEAQMPGFIQVVLQDDAGNNKAQMEVSIDVSCSKPSNPGCGSFAADAVKAALEKVPAVGGLLASGFDVICNAGA